MAKKNLVIKHDLSKLSTEELAQYLRAVSEFIGLDPDLNGLDTIWMDNEGGPGKSLVIYARRGTAEILREIYAIEVDELTDKIVNGSIVFTAKGHSTLTAGTRRQEIATGSKYINGLVGKALDDAIMTASTRAIRRLTMQFTKLGILDQSEVEAVVGSKVNPASAAQPVGEAIVFPAPLPPAAVATLSQFEEDTRKILHESLEGATSLEEAATAAVTTMVEEAEEAVGKPKRARKPKNSISLEGPEAEVVSNEPRKYEPITLTQNLGTTIPARIPSTILDAITNVAVDAAQASPAVPAQAAPAVPLQQDKPTKEQMADFRKRALVYTSQLPASENLGSVQKMRAFIVRTTGTNVDSMTIDQWEDMIGFLESFTQQNGISGLVAHINNTLGVK
jgi:hypothetical protein